MRRLPLPTPVRELSPALWPPQRRACDLTPLYIERYRGPRTSRELAAHPFWELTAVMAGGETLVGPNPVELQPPAVCLIPPGYRHNEFTSHGVDTIWIGFYCRHIIASRYRSTPTVVESKPLTDLMEQAWLFAATTHSRIGPELDAQTANILHRFLRLATEGTREPTTDNLQRAIEYLINHHGEVLHMSAIARRHGFSTGHFHREFRKRTGFTPNAYLTRIRIETAARLLRESSLPAKEIANRVGIADEAYFSRLFKQLSGQNSSSFRNQG
jgi:AraC-like DNA-binding protein